MDSVTLAYLLYSEGYELHLLSMNHGQRHRKEIGYAERLGSSFNIADISSVGGLLSGSALTDQDFRVPVGHYTAENMAVTVVPNHNAIMLSVAYGVAVARSAQSMRRPYTPETTTSTLTAAPVSSKRSTGCSVRLWRASWIRRSACTPRPCTRPRLR